MGLSSLLRPLDVKLAFESRPYTLGESINLAVELKARGDVEIKEGRVDLVCEVRWRESFTMRALPDHPSMMMRASLTRGASLPIPPRVAKRVTHEENETYVHGSVAFAANTRLRSGTADRYQAQLEILPEPPPHAMESSMRWRLVATVEVAQGRSISRKQAIQVMLL